jgi:hypothetical protein
MKLLILFISIITFVECKFSNNMKVRRENTNNKRMDNSICTFETVKKTCVEGHVYYITSQFYQGGIAPKLTDDGKPVECKDEPGIE